MRQVAIHSLNQKERAEYAARYISSGRETDRSFDSCFEMCDGDAVAVALYERVLIQPKTKLAKNIFKYLCKHAVISAYQRSRESTLF